MSFRTVATEERLREKRHARAPGRRNYTYAYLSVAPSAIWSGLYLLLPIVLVVYYSFTKWTGFDSPQFNQFNNYKNLTSSTFTGALRVTLVFAIVGGVVSVFIGFVLGILIQQRLRGWRFYRVAWFAPTLIPGTVVALLWQGGAFYPSTGLADRLITAFGFNPPVQGWLATPRLALLALIIAAIWSASGLPMLLISAAMERIPQEYEEAARIDGAGRYTIAYRITLPLVRPVLGTVLALQIIGLIKAFELVYIMTQGGPEDSTTTVAYLMYNSAFVQGRSGLASAYGVILILLIIPVGLFARSWIGNSDA